MKKSVCAWVSVALLLAVADVCAQGNVLVDVAKLAPGTRWMWSMTDKTSMQGQVAGCSSGIPLGAQQIETVKSVTADGWVSQMEGPQPNVRFDRIYASDGRYRAKARGKDVLAGTIRLPLVQDQTWEAVLASTRVVTELKCKAEQPEPYPFNGTVLSVVPVACEGTWFNIESRSEGRAEYKYWYSGALGNVVRATALTYMRGNTRCFEGESKLEEFSAGR